MVVIDLSQYILLTTYIILKNFIIEDVFIILVNRKSSLGFKIMQTIRRIHFHMVFESTEGILSILSLFDAAACGSFFIESFWSEIGFYEERIERYLQPPFFKNKHILLKKRNKKANNLKEEALSLNWFYSK